MDFVRPEQLEQGRRRWAKEALRLVRSFEYRPMLRPDAMQADIKDGLSSDDLTGLRGRCALILEFFIEESTLKYTRYVMFLSIY